MVTPPPSQNSRSAHFYVQMFHVKHLAKRSTKAAKPIREHARRTASPVSMKGRDRPRASFAALRGPHCIFRHAARPARRTAPLAVRPTKRATEPRALHRPRSRAFHRGEAGKASSRAHLAARRAISKTHRAPRNADGKASTRTPSTSAAALHKIPTVSDVESTRCPPAVHKRFKAPFYTVTSKREGSPPCSACLLTSLDKQSGPQDRASPPFSPADSPSAGPFFFRGPFRSAPANQSDAAQLRLP